MEFPVRLAIRVEAQRIGNVGILDRLSYGGAEVVGVDEGTAAGLVR